MENRTFKFDPETPYLNAVVGSNWLGSNEHAYITGFGQAVEVLLGAAMVTSYPSLVTGEENAIFTDALVYPICFCARHFIELFLKRQIRAVSGLRSGNSESAQATHNLMGLWEHLERLIAMDPRLVQLGKPIKQFIQDFNALDANGEAFRYDEDKDGNTHLISLTHINLEIVAKRMKVLIGLAEDFEDVMEELKPEYAQNTTTDGLSRPQIHAIATRLPKFETWQKGGLDIIKSEIMEELGLSSNAFGRVLNIIRSHREFSLLIGIEMLLPGFDPGIFDRLKAIATDSADPKSISDSEWACLEAVLQVGHDMSYSEEYDRFALGFSHPDRQNPLDWGYIKRGVLSGNNRFRTGLRKMGQKTLLAAFDELYPEVPQPPRDKDYFEKLLQGVSSFSVQ